MENPFSSRGGIVAKQQDFIGRKEEILLIRQRLTKNKNDNNMSIVAYSGMGGSSLVYMALESIEAELLTRKILLVNIKLTDSPDTFFKKLIKNIYNRIKNTDYNTTQIENAYNDIIAIKEDLDFFDAMVNLLKIIKLNEIKIIAIFDDFDNIRKIFKNRIDLFQKLRDLAYYPNYKISWIIISKRTIKQIELQSNTISTYYGVFSDKIILKPFDEDEVKEYWKLYERVGIELDKNQKELIFYYCGGYPKLLNQLGYEIIDYYFIHKKIYIDTIFSRIEHLFTSFYEQTLDICTDKEKMMLAEIASEPIFQPPEELTKGLLIMEKGKYRLFSEHFANYLRYKEQKRLSIISFSLNNYYAIKNIEIKDIPHNTQWIFITGENGYGKSLILKSLFIGLNGEEDNNKILIKNQSNGSFEYNIELRYEIKKNEQSEYYEILDVPKSKIPKLLAAYGASRLLVRSDTAEQKADEESSVSYSLFNDDGVLLNIEQKLSFWSRQEPSKYEIVRQTLINLLPHIEDLKVNKSTEKVEYKELNSKKILSRRQLASGPRSIIAMVGDMIIRLYEQQNDVLRLDELGGIVIIDEIDLHLHPKWQKKLVEILSKTFPNVQFIASTHSFIPFLGAPANSVYIKATRDNEKGIIAKKLDLVVPPKEMLPNTLISSPLFDMDEFINSASENFRTENTYSEIVNNVRKLEESEEIELPDDF